MTDQSDGGGETRPSVSVLMPVYNGAEHVAKAIDSVLAQTVTDFELVVVDDGSTDDTAAVLASYAHDPRVRVVRHDTNGGLVASLNDGLQACRAELVARLDADDISMPTRLQRQKEVFDANPAVVLCATAYVRFLPSGQVLREGRPPLTHGGLAMAMFTGNRLCHSSVMFRRSAVVALGGYDPTWFPVEDYDLWIRLMETGRYTGVSSTEVRYLENPEGISASKAAVQLRYHRARTDGYRQSLAAAAAVAETEATSRTPRAQVRRVESMRRGLRKHLTDRGIPLVGVDDEAYRRAFETTLGRSRIARHTIVASAAPDDAGTSLAASTGSVTGDRSGYGTATCWVEL